MTVSAMTVLDRALTKTFDNEFNLGRTQHNRPWGVPPDAKIVGFLISRSMNAKFRKVAKASGKNKSWILDQFMRNLTIAARSVPQQAKQKAVEYDDLTFTTARVSALNHRTFKAACKKLGMGLGEAINALAADFNERADEVAFGPCSCVRRRA